MRQFVMEEGLGVSAFHSTNKLQRDHLTALTAGGLLSDNPVPKPCALKSSFEKIPQNLSYHWRLAEEYSVELFIFKMHYVAPDTLSFRRMLKYYTVFVQ